MAEPAERMGGGGLLSRFSERGEFLLEVATRGMYLMVSSKLETRRPQT